jgi:N-carbamoyl-L-amino-acid hydrolase
VHRLAYTDVEAEARRLLLDWAYARGYTAALDDIGNMFIRRPGGDAAAAPVLSGSHMDSQPKGGKYDGIYGVLAAFEVLEALDDAGIRTKRPIEVAVWAAEEGGSRYLQGCMGSQVYVDPGKLESMQRNVDAQGVSVADAVRAFRAKLPDLPKRALNAPVSHFIEGHIEQGPILQATGNTIGVVTGIQGARYFQVDVVGDAAHAGTTPPSQRKDAVKAAAAMITALHQMMQDDSDVVRFTIGHLDVTPNAMAVVPGQVGFTIDFRHPDEAFLTRMGDLFQAVCDEHAGPCSVKVTQVRRGALIKFEGLVPDTIHDASTRLGYRTMRIMSGAGHDARYLAGVCPTGMIFVPCDKGISHNEVEAATPADLAAGARVLAEVLVALAQS